MANIKSKEKRIKTNEVRRQRNQKTKSEIKTLTKRVDEISNQEKTDDEALAKAIVDAQKKIDSATSKGRMHKKKAARKVGQLMKKANTEK